MRAAPRVRPPRRPDFDGVWPSPVGRVERVGARKLVRRGEVATPLGALLLAGAFVLGGCASGGGGDAGDEPADAGRGARDAGRPDAGPGPRDAGGGMDAGPGVDAGPGDAGPPFDAGPAPDAGDCSEADAVTISEIMVSSQSGSGDRGEWFELRNETGCPISLSGLVVESGGAQHTVTSGLLTAGGYAVLAQSADATDNHGLSPDYVYGPGISFGNGGGALAVRRAGVEIARVRWGSTDHRRSTSRQLSRAAPETLELGASEWCDSTAVYSMMSGGPFLGTPGMRNALCP